MNQIYKGNKLWIDELADITPPGSILLSDLIQYYAESEICMIEPFDVTSLRPAGYTLHVGDTYCIDDVEQELTERGKITIPPNGFVYIRTKECLHLPYYILARYSLKVKLVYSGLLIDSGLHVDPGYYGHINIPVHNFSNQKRELEFGKEFLVVDFTKTSRFLGDYNRAILLCSTEKELVDKSKKGEINGYEGKQLVVFQSQLKELYEDRSIKGYFEPSQLHSSSLDKMNKKVRRMKRKFKIGFYTLVALLISFFTLMIYIVTWTSDRTYNLQNLTKGVQAESILNNESIEKLEKQNQTLMFKVDKLLTNITGQQLYNQNNKILLDKLQGKIATLELKINQNKLSSSKTKN